MPPSLGQTVCGRVAGKWWPQRVHSRWVRRDMDADRLTFSEFAFRTAGFGETFVSAQLWVVMSAETAGFGASLTSGLISSFADMADLKPRMLSPRPLPSSGSFLGPKTSNAIPNITSMCRGWNSPSNMVTPFLDQGLKIRG